MVFRCKNGNFFFINTFCPEMSQNVFQTWFAAIFMMSGHQNGKNGIFDDFRSILVVFSGYHKIPNLDVNVPPNLEFLAKIRFSGSKTIFDMIGESSNLLLGTRSKIALKIFCIFYNGIFGDICTNLKSAPNKHLLK